MTYEKHEWKNDEVITAERLNSIEDGLDRSINISNSPSILKSGDILTFQRGSQMLGLQYKKEYVKVASSALKDGMTLIYGEKMEDLKDGSEIRLGPAEKKTQKQTSSAAK